MKDEPLWAPGRMWRAVRWYFWWRVKMEQDSVTFVQVFLNYRRAQASKDRY